MKVLNPSYDELMSIHDNTFFNQIEYLKDLVESIAKNNFVEVEHLCVGMGYSDTSDLRNEVLFYYDHPDMFKCYYYGSFEYPRTPISNKVNAMKKHYYWITYNHLKEIVDSNILE